MSEAAVHRDRPGSERAMLAIEELTVHYGKVRALNDVSMHVEQGEVVTVIGPNGAGKSTLADAIAGFLSYEGRLRYRGREIAAESQVDLIGEGLIYCTEERDLFKFLSVRDNLRLGAYRSSGDFDAQLEFIYDLFPRLAERVHQKAHTMSGGEQQMLAIARALAGQPEFLLVDEASLGLAPVILDDISEAFETINGTGVTLLLLEQNNVFVQQEFVDRVYLLENGEIEWTGTPDEISSNEYIQKAYLGVDE